MKKLFVAVVATLLLIVSCAAKKTVLVISYEHLNRNPRYVSLGVYSQGNWWVELIDDTKTSHYWDECVWKSVQDGQPYYVDTVLGDGSIQRYGPKYKNDKRQKGYVKTEVLTFKDGSLMTSFQYYHYLVVLRLIPR